MNSADLSRCFALLFLFSNSSVSYVSFELISSVMCPRACGWAITTCHAIVRRTAACHLCTHLNPGGVCVVSVKDGNDESLCGSPILCVFCENSHLCLLWDCKRFFLFVFLFFTLYIFLYKFDSVVQVFFFCLFVVFCLFFEGMNCMNKFIHIFS